jgi:tetratricopeptide (TPR) repeat protein
MAAELKSYTIVPDSLYVERRADKQLHNIIEAMQRPGYVLVSRQMGKTNLLLRAKRKWENDDDLYVYIDMSNINETEKDCFESLIDTAIDTHENLLGGLREKIEILRRKNIIKSPVQAHNEELRFLLKSIKGKLVFILDEIDSLTRTSFSDNVFSQIRSTYFSRVNYPVLEKLTYVLSGVVEPTEIIKNPKISPFNIGEKIHLDDFTQEEYLTFINKAELNWLEKDVIERVFYWAAGNPRITWDICYELQHSKDQTPEKVDALVKEMYLTSYDKAPIDTIRTLVKEDRDLRDAIVQLAYDRGDALSDKIKNKLYLAGIVNYNDNEIRIKNRIINNALSMTWLQKVEEEDKGLLAYAVELHAKGLYKDSIEKFEYYLKNNDFPETSSYVYYYYIGSCYYHLNNYDRSLEYLKKIPFEPQVPYVDYRQVSFYKGADYLKLGRYQDAQICFEKVKDGEERDDLYFSAKLNSLTALQHIESADVDNQNMIIGEYKSILALPEGIASEEIKLYTSYQLATLYLSKDEKNEADKYFNIALLYAKDTAKLRIVVDKYFTVPDEQHDEILNDVVSLVIGIEKISGTIDPDNSLETDETVFERALYLIYYYAYDKWPIVKGKITILKDSYGDILFKVFLQSVLASDIWGEGAQRLIKELHDNISTSNYGLSQSSVLHVCKFNAFLSYTKENAKEYIDTLRASGDSIDSIGLTVVRTYAWSLLEENRATIISEELDWILKKYPTQFTHQDMVTRAFLEYSLLMSYFSNRESGSMVAIANQILSYVDNVIDKANDKNRTSLQRVKENALQALQIFKRREPVRSSKSYERNDRVRVKYVDTGILKEMKFKLVEDDILEGRCVIVEE